MADAAAVITIPVLVGTTVYRRALTLTSYGVPVVVVGAQCWAANTLANRFVPNQVTSTFFGCTFACAVVDVKVLISSACYGRAALALTSLSAPEKVVLARIFPNRFDTDAVTDFSIKNVRLRTLLWHAKASTCLRIKVFSFWTNLVVTNAFTNAVIRVPFVSFIAGLGLAFACA